MKKLISALKDFSVVAGFGVVGLTLAISIASYSPSTYAGQYIPCQSDIVFKANTVSGKKFVEVCQIGNAYRYSFVQPSSTHPEGIVEKEIIQSALDTEFEDEMGRMNGISMINFDAGKTRYSVGYMLSDGVSSYHILVTTNGKQIADVKLSDKGVINKISEHAANAL